MAITRQEFEGNANISVCGPKSSRVTRRQAIAAYTLNTARQLGRENEIGSIEVGKRTDFVVSPESLFTTETYSVQHVKPDAVFLDGEAVAGSNL